MDGTDGPGQGRAPRDRGRSSGRHPLVLAGPVQPGQEDYFRSEIEPHIDGHAVVFLGEVGGVHRKELFARAKAFVMPIRWAEPFGMVMVEALACGTPVIAFPEGAASEIVIDGENGFHVADEQSMAAAVGLLDAIDPARCRESVTSRYDAAIVADGYEAVYDHAIRGQANRARRSTRHVKPLPRGETEPTGSGPRLPCCHYHNLGRSPIA